MINQIIKNILSYRTLLLALSVCLFIFANSQPPAAPVFESPEVHADNKVTFRYLAPNAKEVKLSAQFEKAPLTMTKDDRGVWSITAGR